LARHSVAVQGRAGFSEDLLIKMHSERFFGEAYIWLHAYTPPPLTFPDGTLVGAPAWVLLGLCKLLKRGCLRKEISAIDVKRMPT
jgi:hypothetical protein